MTPLREVLCRSLRGVCGVGAHNGGAEKWGKGERTGPRGGLRQPRRRAHRCTSAVRLPSAAGRVPPSCVRPSDLRAGEARARERRQARATHVEAGVQPAAPHRCSSPVSRPTAAGRVPARRFDPRCLYGNWGEHGGGDRRQNRGQHAVPGRCSRNAQRRHRARGRAAAAVEGADVGGGAWRRAGVREVRGGKGGGGRSGAPSAAAAQPDALSHSAPPVDTNRSPRAEHTAPGTVHANVMGGCRSSRGDGGGARKGEGRGCGDGAAACASSPRRAAARGAGAEPTPASRPDDAEAATSARSEARRTDMRSCAPRCCLHDSVRQHESMSPARRRRKTAESEGGSRRESRDKGTRLFCARL